MTEFEWVCSPALDPVFQYIWIHKCSFQQEETLVNVYFRYCGQGGTFPIT